MDASAEPEGVTPLHEMSVEELTAAHRIAVARFGMANVDRERLEKLYTAAGDELEAAKKELTEVNAYMIEKSQDEARRKLFAATPD